VLFGNNPFAAGSPDKDQSRLTNGGGQPLATLKDYLVSN